MAQEYQEKALQIALEGRQKQLPATGYCYYCSESISLGKRFCDEYCRDDWEREQRLRQPAID